MNVEDEFWICFTVQQIAVKLRAYARQQPFVNLESQRFEVEDKIKMYIEKINSNTANTKPQIIAKNVATCVATNLALPSGFVNSFAKFALFFKQKILYRGIRIEHSSIGRSIVSGTLARGSKTSFG